MIKVSSHDIKADGKKYIMEWDKEDGHIAITECTYPEGCTCEEDGLDDCECPLETYDYYAESD